MKKMLTASLLLIGLATLTVTAQVVPKEPTTTFKTELSVSKVNVDFNYEVVNSTLDLPILSVVSIRDHQSFFLAAPLKDFEFELSTSRYRYNRQIINNPEKISPLQVLSVHTLKVPPKLRC